MYVYIGYYVFMYVHKAHEHTKKNVKYSPLYHDILWIRIMFGNNKIYINKAYYKNIHCISIIA